MSGGTRRLSALTDRARLLVDAALDRVFDEPFDIRSADDFVRVVDEHRSTTGVTSLASAGTLTRFVEGALPLVMLSKKAGRRLPIPAVKYALAAIPVALHLGSTVRHGVHELQVLASYVIDRFRAAGIDAERGLVTALTLSIALDPERRPDVGLTLGRASPGLARRWIVRSALQESASAATRRAKAEAAAVERLDLPGLSKAWSSRPRQRPYDR
jgi:hypothetical protein